MEFEIFPFSSVKSFAEENGGHWRRIHENSNKSIACYWRIRYASGVYECNLNLIECNVQALYPALLLLVLKIWKWATYGCIFTFNLIGCNAFLFRFTCGHTFCPPSFHSIYC